MKARRIAEGVGQGKLGWLSAAGGFGRKRARGSRPRASIYIAQVQSAPQRRPALQRQASPQRQVAPQPQPASLSFARKVFSALIIVCLHELAWRIVRKPIAIATVRSLLERNSYDISREAAGIPNIRLNVRLRCAELEKPA